VDPGELSFEIVSAEAAENPENPENNLASTSGDTMVESAESVADGGVEGHSTAEPGEEQVP
jgi:hypothetical protein